MHYEVYFLKGDVCKLYSFGERLNVDFLSCLDDVARIYDRVLAETRVSQANVKLKNLNTV